jgi:hypothetical protein
MAGSSESDDSDRDNLSEHEYAGGSSDPDGGSEVADSKPEEDEQVEESSAAAVLQLPELLHMIISEVPRENGTSLRRVSKQWQATIVKVGYALEPLEQIEDPPTDLGPGQPTYPLQVSFKPSPLSIGDSQMLLIGPNYSFEESRPMVHRVEFHPFPSVAELREKGNQFITDPPLTQVLVHKFRTYPGVPLKVSGGIWIRDLAECFQAWTGQEQKSLYCATFAGPRKIKGRSYSEKYDLDELGDESYLDGDNDSSEFGNSSEGDGVGESEAGGDEPANPSTPDEPNDESEEGSSGESEEGVGGDDPADSSAPDGNGEKADDEASEHEQVGASSKVLLTNELLHMIISDVPREHRTTLRRVSKNWKATVEKIGHALDPFDHEPSRYEDFDPLPLYTSQTIFKRNPVFLDYVGPIGVGPDPALPACRIMSRTLHQHLPSRLFTKLSAEKGQLFIKRPPLTEVSVGIGYNGADSTRLQVNGGIRLQDVLDHVQRVGGGTHIELVCVSFGGPREVVVYKAGREVRG